MKQTILPLFLLTTFGVFAQTDSLHKSDLAKELEPLKNSIESLQKENKGLRTKIIYLNKKIDQNGKFTDSIQRQTLANSNAIAQTANELGIKITETEAMASQKIIKVDKSLNQNSIFGVVGVVLAIFVSAFIYWRLSKKQKTDKSEIARQLVRTKENIEESLVREFAKQTEIVQNQLTEQQKSADKNNVTAEPDHALALKVAGEINLMERNISLMNKETKGLKQLLRSVQKLKDNLSANGYEIPEMIGKPFHKGMKVIVINSIPDENIEKDTEIITKILIPQVNYNDKMIQTAQIEVSVGV